MTLNDDVGVICTVIRAQDEDSFIGALLMNSFKLINIV